MNMSNVLYQTHQSNNPALMGQSKRALPSPASGQGNRSRQNPTTLSDLIEREREIVEKLQGFVSVLGVSVKVVDAEPLETDRGIAVTAFAKFESSDSRSPFVISRDMLALLAECRTKLNSFLSRMDENIALQQKNRKQEIKHERYVNQREQDRRNQQMMLNMKTAFDFWNDNRDGGNSWTQPTNGQGLKSMVGLYTANLSGGN